MSVLNKITDKEFVPFLQSLGVDTCNKSFEWMLNDRNFAGVLEWMYTNLDSDNVLTPRERHRYTEIEKTKDLPAQDELDGIIENIQNSYPGICLPGNVESKEDIQTDIKMQKNRLQHLEKQERIFKELTEKIELRNDELNLELNKINGALQLCSQEEEVTANECLRLAEEMDVLTDDVIDVVAEAMDVYKGSDDKAVQRFFTFGPFDKYKHSQDLFQSHFELYTNKKFPKRVENVSTYNGVLNEAKLIEGRLMRAIHNYVESAVELSGDQAQLSYVNSYSTPHISQLDDLILETQSAVQLLEREEDILSGQIQNAVKEYVEERTALVEDTSVKAALLVREEVHNNLAHLLVTTQQALGLDRVLYRALRQELCNVEDFLMFASHLREHVTSESDAVHSRIISMKEICDQQNACEQQLNKSDTLVEYLVKILHKDSNDDQFVKSCKDIESDIIELKENIGESYRKREKALEIFKTSTRPLHSHIWDGCTKQPNTIDRTVSSLTHSLRHEMKGVEDRVVEASARFHSVKNGDKHQLRKLWQWFLSDPAKLQSIINTVQSRNYS